MEDRPPEDPEQGDARETDEDAARRERARRLREDIAGEAGSTAPDEAGRDHESPRDFVERRRRELEGSDEPGSDEGSETT